MDDFQFQTGQFLSDLLIKCIVELKGINPEQEKAFFALYEQVQKERGVHSVRFTVDGFELPVKEAFDTLEKQLDEVIKAAAVRLLKEKFEHVEEQIALLSDLLAQTRREIANRAEKELGVELPKDDWD